MVVVTAERILDAAEKRMRKGGYNGVNYRDLATDIGIKSSSVHYHFSRKEDLGVALVGAVGRFFAANIAWTNNALSPAMSPNDRQKFAVTAIATLQGGMILASTLKEPKLFESVVDSVLAGVEN